MKEFELLRYYANDGDYKMESKNNKNYYFGATIGALCDISKPSYPPFCYTLERPLFYKGQTNKKDDKSTKTINESCCINPGEYLLKWTFSPKYKRNMYTIVGIQGRLGIRAHSGNTIDDIEGCILLGNRIIKNVDMKGNIYDYIVSESKDAVKKFENYCNGEDVRLIIKDIDQQANLSKLKIY